MSRRIVYEALAGTVGKPIAEKLARGNRYAVFTLLAIGAITGVYFGLRGYWDAHPRDKELWEVMPYIFGIVGAFAGALMGAFLPFGRRQNDSDDQPPATPS